MYKRYLWTNLRVSPMREPSRQPSYFIAVIEDVDERKPAELALRSLTAREREVLSLLARGRANAEIAQKLFITERTAKFHVGNVLEKLGVEDRRQAAERAAELGLLPPRRALVLARPSSRANSPSSRPRA